MVKSRADGRQASPKLAGFLADHDAKTRVVEIGTAPHPVFAEEMRGATHLNFDFALQGVTDRTLDLVFLKVAAYDADGTLGAYRYLNRNAVGQAGIETVGPTTIAGREVVDLFNPFHTFPSEVGVNELRYMFTFRDAETGEEFYYGNVIVRPWRYRQQAVLGVPVKGLVTVLDGYDFYSHHRRFAMSVARAATDGAMQSNFARYALDFVHIGEDGNTRRMSDEERRGNYDFHFVDARRFYSDGAPIYAPGSGVVAVAEDGHEDLYDEAFDFDAAVAGGRVGDMAGNHVAIEHNAAEFSHLFHLKKGSVAVEVGQRVSAGDLVGHIGFSGAATLYSHLHYQFMDGPDFLDAAALPVRFNEITLVRGGRRELLHDAPLDTGDIAWVE